MRVGASQVEITPEPGIELCGFAARTQPSVGVLDPLHVKCLYVEDGAARLLWVHADVLGLERETVQAFRAWAREALGLDAASVMVSATHTHAAPAVMLLQEAGRVEPAYLSFFEMQLREAARRAVACVEPAELVSARGWCDLAVDRRGKASAHTDPQVGAVGFRRANGEFIAAVTNYAIHPVALGPANRCVSADIPGAVAASLQRELSGSPIVLATSGACGNLNPPTQSVTWEQVQAWGRRIAAAVLEPLRSGPAWRGEDTAGMSVPQFNTGGTPVPHLSTAGTAVPHEFTGGTAVPQGLRAASRVVGLPQEVLSAAEVDAWAEAALRNAGAVSQWGERFRRAIQGWASAMKDELARGIASPAREAELHALALGPMTFVGVNGELFSRFTSALRERTGRTNLYTVGYANGNLGYLPTREAYAEGGYEVEEAHLFYRQWRVREGGLELLAGVATELV